MVSEDVSFISITREQLLSYFPPFTIKKNLIRMLSCYLNNNFGWSQIKYTARGSEFAEKSLLKLTLLLPVNENDIKVLSYK